MMYDDTLESAADRMHAAADRLRDRAAEEARHPNAPGTELDGPPPIGEEHQAESRGRQRPVDAGDYIVPLRDFVGDDEPDDDDSEDWIVRDIIPRGAPWLLAGPMKASKSIAMLDLSIAVALGEGWLGQENTVKGPGKVLIVEQEDNARRTRARLWWLAKGRGIDPRDLDGLLSVNVVDFFYPQRPEDEAKMRRSVEAFEPSLVLIDSMRRSLVGNENDSDVISAFGRVWLELCRDFDVSVGVLHHLKKNPGEGDNLLSQVRGSGDIVAIARHIVGIRRLADDANLRALEVDGNYTHGLEPFAFALVDGEDNRGKKMLRLDHRGPVQEQADRILDSSILAVLRKDGPLSGRAVEGHAKVKAKAQRVRAALKRLEEAGTIFREAKGKPYVAAPEGAA